jgi:DNA helicase II / ATP-dependent DNA helicase PcrA
MKPTAGQLAVRDEPELGLLVLAPAGCGKTEALALRVAGLLDQGLVRAPRKVLVATFTNRARDNIRERLRKHVRSTDFRDRVTVQNFHGLAARIFLAHAGVIGLDPEMALPERDWVADQCRVRRLSFPETSRVTTALRQAKQVAQDDAAVLTALAGNPIALAIEQQRQQEQRMTYDDLLRYAELILAEDAVADLYRNHFACAVVDEFQDLTPQQLRVVHRIGYGRTTYAGDLTQGIFGFAGADPEAVMLSIEGEVKATLTLNESHRSSPAVLAMVNGLGRSIGGQTLVSADPAGWPGGGVAARVPFANTAGESQWILDVARYICGQAPGQRVAVIARTNNRRRFIDELAAETGDLDFYRWDDAVLDTETAPLLRQALRRVTTAAFHQAADPLAYLVETAQVENIQDPHTRGTLLEALGWAADLLNDGSTPEAVSARIRVGDGDTLLTKPGLHLLTAHVGKGQQFDWVFVIGLEDGCLPDFRATSADALAEEARVLSVMLSRARHGVVLTSAESVADLSGKIRMRSRSDFLSRFNDVTECGDAAGLSRWLESADWAAIEAKR